MSLNFFLEICIFECLLFLEIKIEEPKSMCVCVCVCVSLASDASETIEVIVIKLSIVSASDMVMHHINYVDLNLQSRSEVLIMNKCSIIYEAKQRKELSDRTDWLAARPALGSLPSPALSTCSAKLCFTWPWLWTCLYGLTSLLVLVLSRLEMKLSWWYVLLALVLS